MNMELACFEVEQWEKKYVKQKLPRHNIAFFQHELTEGDVKKIKNVECLVVHVYSQCSAKVLSKLPRLKYIVTMATGYENIDLSYSKRKGIVVMNVPVYGKNTVAEFTFALLLTLTRKLYPTIKRVKEQNEFYCGGLTGTDLLGKTIGVVGTGSIGSHVIRIAHGFNMKIVACGHHAEKELIKQYNVKYVTMETLLKKADVVTLHIPYTPENHHMINKETIGLMKRGAILINTARGALVDTDALYQALKTKKLSGAALDVLEMECEIKEERQLLSKKMMNGCKLRTVLENHQLMKMENVIITPHNAWHTREALLRILDITIRNIQSCKKRRQSNRITQ